MGTSKEAQFVGHVLQLTQSNELKWRRTDAPTTLYVGTDSKIFDFFSAKLGEKILGIYELRSPIYDGDRDKFYWTNEIALALFNRQMDQEYTFSSPGVADLFSEVKRQAAGVDDFLKSILGEDEN
jgi:hypothetical protein